MFKETPRDEASGECLGILSAESQEMYVRVEHQRRRSGYRLGRIIARQQLLKRIAGGFKAHCAEVRMQCSLNDTALSSILPPVLIAEFILGALGNAFALWIFCFHLRPWRSSTVLLVSLAVADCLLLVALPFRASYYHSGFEWRFGNALCAVCHFLVASNRTGSVVFLIAIALDRYVRVLHPHHPLNFLSVSKAACGAAVLWLGTVSMGLFFTLSKTNSGYCGSFSRQSERNYSVSPQRLAFLLGFYAPFLAILLSTACVVKHLRGRRIARHAEVQRALSVMTAIVVLFAVCFLPSNVTQLVIWFKARDAADAARFCGEMRRLTVVYSVTVSLTYLNSALDPVVYYFSSSEFRRRCCRALARAPEEPRETATLSVSESRGPQP